MITIKQVTIDEVLPHLGDLFVEHREELTTHKDLMKLNPDIETYYRLEDNGMLIVLGVFDNEEVVGYSTSIVTKNLHYQDLVYSNNDLLFLTKKYRNTKVGLELIRETERVCRDKGAKFHLCHAKENTTLSTLLPKLGYTVQDIIYSKEL